MKIAINALSAKTGGGVTYLNRLIYYLRAADKENDYFIFVTRDNHKKIIGFEDSRFHVIEVHIRSLLHRLLYEQGKSFDRVILGHFHDPVDTERYIVNGSFMGCTEYSVSKLFAGGAPAQIMLYVHPEHGVVSSERIYLKPADDRADLELPDVLQDVWALSEV